MVQGPDVYICSSCVQDAAGMMDGESRARDHEGEPDREDWQAAYSFLQDAAPPIVDLLRRSYENDSELYWLAHHIRAYRQKMDTDDLSRIVQAAVSLDVRSALRTQNQDQ